ncbi:F0F1 ATP synthase subunit delta [Allohahella marinimesophila]|uniref:ATP synthase subunit delta n=1 Tax=Allohahella marinimesophila TaxID=1054972 RepID=A0ABP7PBS9_9GAMM
MAQSMTLARPYARAAFEKAKQDGSIDQWSTALLSLASYVEQDQVRDFIVHPGLSQDAQAETLLQLSGDDVRGDEITNFLSMLAQNDRLVVLPEISALFEQHKAEQEQSLDVSVTSAFELSDQEKETLASALKTKLNKNIQLTTTVDKALIGGVVIHAGDMTIDGSVRGRLQKLSETMGS